MDRRLSQSADARFERYATRARSRVERSADALLRVRDAYQRAYHAEFVRWGRLQGRIDGLEGRLRRAPGDDAIRGQLRGLMGTHAELTLVLTQRRAELTRLELVLRAIESSRLLLEDPLNGTERLEEIPVDIQIRVVEAKEAERAHLAQEIHDGPAQALANAIFQVDFIQRVIEKAPAKLPGELRLLRESLQQALAEVRSYITQLRPPRLLQLGLYGAIGEAAENVRALSGVAFETHFDAPEDVIDEAAQIVALRIAQEALQNTRKHASATLIRITTAVDGAHWTLQVSDDGDGFDPAPSADREGKSFGLQFMRERARLIGADIAVRSTTGGGTVVALAIPLRKEIG